MTNYTEQIQRIRNKLIETQKRDANFDAFGADKHRYMLNEPATIESVEAFEEQYTIGLPDCYKSFLLNIGNGGIGIQNSGAGPFYGIYPLGENTDELIRDYPEKYLQNECLLVPKMTDEQWEALTKRITETENITDENYQTEIGKLWGGILPIGSQGCTYLHGIVLNGQYKGRVINLDSELRKPRFAFELNFLDWYERWLDEIISGDFKSTNWFGYNKAGSEEELLAGYFSSKETEEKEDCLNGLLIKHKLKPQTVNQLEELITTSASHKKVLIQILCKSNYEKAKPHLIALGKEDLLSVFIFIYLYAEHKSEEWFSFIEENIHRVDDEDTFRFCTYLLRGSRKNYGTFILPFTKHSKQDMRRTAYSILGHLRNKFKRDILNELIEGLYDTSPVVIHATLEALENLKDYRLLKHYKVLAEKFSNEQEYLISTLNLRLAEYNFNNETILTREFKS